MKQRGHFCAAQSSLVLALVAMLLATLNLFAGPARAEGAGLDSATLLRIAGEKRVALVIGNGRYEKVAALPNPQNDARDMGSALAGLGFDVTLLENAGRSALQQALLAFSDRAVGADIALVFYAGHGIEVNRQNYLIPVDARLETDRHLRFEATSLDDVLGALEAVRGVRIVLLDACRNNPFASTMRMSSPTRSVGRGLSRIEAPGGTLVSYAANEGTIADDGEGANSPFTAALLENLGTPGIEINLLFRKVRDSVLGATGGRQEPFVSASLPSDPIYFVPPLAPAEAVAPGAADASSGPSRTLDAERAWDVTKDSDSPAILQAFIDQFPGTVYARFAAARLGEVLAAREPASETATAAGVVEPSAPPPPVATSELEPEPEDVVVALADPAATQDQALPDLDPADLARAVQEELGRLGCDPGTPDGVWGPASRRAASSFAQHASVELVAAEPTPDLLASLKTYQDRVCPLACGARYTAIGGSCVLKTCKSGQILTRSGTCVDRAASAPARAPAAARPRPVPNPPARAATQADPKACAPGCVWSIRGKGCYKWAREQLDPRNWDRDPRFRC